MFFRLDWGYYLCRGLVFTDKLSALARADGARVSFHFNDGAYAKAHVEPHESLGELYRRRAQELRDRYGYLILMYSGGADSHQMLCTFLRNKIVIDEVRHYQALGFVERLDHDPVGDGLDLLREYRRHVVHGLKAVRKHSPGTRINVIDTTRCYSERRWDDAAAFETALWPRPLNPLFMGLKRDFEADDLREHVGGRQSIGVVYAVDKPMLNLVDDRLYLFFPDTGRAGLYVVQNAPINYEMFYWGSPEITIKQAHVVKRALRRHPAALVPIREKNGGDVLLDFPGVDLSVIYPDWRRQAYTKEQADDPRLISHFIDAPLVDLAALRRRRVAALYCDGRTDDFVGQTRSQFHYIGKIDALQAAPDLDKNERRPLRLAVG